MIYAVIETETENADTGKLIGLRKNIASAINLASQRHKQAGLRVFVASKTNLCQPLFELAANRETRLLADLKAILKENDERRQAESEKRKSRNEHRANTGRHRAIS